MNNEPNIFKRPMFWIGISVIYTWLFTSAKFIATIGPVIIIAMIANTDRTISLAEFYQSFLALIEEGSKRLNLVYEYLFFSMLMNLVLFIPTIVIGIFVFRKKLWARNAMIALLAILAFCPLAIGALTSEPTGGNFDYNMPIFLSAIYLFKTSHIKSVFS